MAQNNRRGALAQKPQFSVATDASGLSAQERQIQSEIARRGGAAKAPGFASRLAQVQQAQGALGQTPQNPTFDYTTGQSNQAIAGTFDKIRNLPAMNMDYGAMRTKAEQMAMDSFNRNMQPQMQREEQAMRDRWAQQGIDPNSERARLEFEQLKTQQGAMQQNAMSSAFQAGQGEQNQMFNQGVVGQMLPYQQLGALQPFYASQANAQMQGQQNTWQGQQNEKNRQAQLAAARMGGGGGMTMQDRFALMDAETQQRMSLMAQEAALNRGETPNYNNQIQNSAINGATNGVTNSVVTSLLK